MTCSFLGHHPFISTFLSTPNLPFSQKTKPIIKHNLVVRVTCASTTPPARDRVIDFGKYKGRMLGTLPSSYLKWVSNNLRAQDFEDWAKLADQVLQDPVYNDRVEWEYAERLLSGDVAPTTRTKSEGGAVDELLDISQRFGWDNDDKVGWSKVNFQLLGTSKGGRIPRVKEGRKEKETAELRKRESRGGAALPAGRRDERRERSRMKREVSPRQKSHRFDNVGGDEGGSSRRMDVGSSDGTNKVYNPFPGRETLLRKALSRRNIT